MISEDWLRWGLAFLISAASAAAVSVITTQNSLGYIEKRQDSDAAQIREVLAQRDKSQSLAFDGVRLELAWLKQSIDDLRQRFENKFGIWEDFEPKHFVRVAVEQLPSLPDPTVRLIFDDELRTMRTRLDAYVEQLKAGKLDDEERDDMYSLEIDYEIKKGWQAWCESSDARRSECWKWLLKKRE